MTVTFVPETFEPHVGSKFSAEAGPARLEMMLTRVERGRSSPGLLQFSLFFSGALEQKIEQQIVRLGHSSIGEFDLFLVPIAREGNCIVYQAVFSVIDAVESK
jgi:hypothetical protein